MACNVDNQCNYFQKWPPDPQHFTQADLDMTLEAAVADPDTSMGPNEVTSAPNTAKPFWKRGRPISK